MKNSLWLCVVSCALFVAGTGLLPRAATACLPPPMAVEVEATVPSRDATGVSLSPMIAVHLVELRAADSSSFWLDEELPFDVRLVDEAGTEVDSLEGWNLEPAYTEDERHLIVFPSEELSPNSSYQVLLQRGETSYEWQFTTGDGDATAEPVEPLETDISAYYSTRDVTSCCETEQVGECPRCFTIGQEPVAAVRADFDLLSHPQGTGAYVYALQFRDDPDAPWEDVETRTFSQGTTGTLTYVDDSLRFNEYSCIRVVVSSIFEQPAIQQGETNCLGPDQWGQRPDYELDSSNVECGDETTEDDVEEDDTEEDDTDGDDFREDEEAEERSDEELEQNQTDDPGWEFSEHDGTGADSGCCASVSGDDDRRGGPLWVSLLLFAGLFFRRARRP